VDVNLILKIIGVGFLVAFAHTLLKQTGKEDFAFWVTVAASVVVFVLIVQVLGDLFSQVQSVFRLF